MGASDSTPLDPAAQEAVEEWWRTSPSLDRLFFDDAFLQELLSEKCTVSNANRSLSPVAYSTLSEGMVALNAGVRPDRMISVVEQLLIELESSCASSSHSQDASLQRRLRVMQGINQYIKKQKLGRFKCLESTADGFEPGQSNKPTTTFPARYVATQQVRDRGKPDSYTFKPLFHSSILFYLSYSHISLYFCVQ